MSLAAELPELTPDERARMEELRPMVEATLAHLLAAISVGAVRDELRAMTTQAHAAAERSEALVREAEEQLRRAEAVIAER